MCGIAGYYSDKEPINKELFDQMVDIIEYRGPNDRGVYFDGNLALGHRRLSIFDVSSAGHQPFRYEDKYVLVYNGEIYNYIEIREELKEKGKRASEFVRKNKNCERQMAKMVDFIKSQL